MKGNMEERAVLLARYIVENEATVRAAAGQFGVSKSTVHKDVSQRLRRQNPGLYREVRKVLARNKAEDAKVSVRNIRRKAKEEIDRSVKDGEAGEDEGTRAEKELEQVTKRHVDTIDELLRHKESELLEV